jgi:hypothetical protein
LSGTATFRLLSLLGLLDKLVFPANPIPIVIIAKNKQQEDPDSPFLHYSYDNSSGKEGYAVFESLDYRIKEVLKRRRHIYFNELLKLRSLEKLQPVSEEEFLVGLAAHEVRHRVQKLLNINLFSPEDAERAEDPDIKVLLMFVAITMTEKGLDSLPNFPEEYDAYVIEHLAARKRHEGSTLQEIAIIIKESAEKLLGDTTPDFLFCLRLFISKDLK